ncbi:MAG: A/G-specific adenine glycosylase [bacterium]|nr:A/G-specific adenine glycosylase [bacterium]
MNAQKLLLNWYQINKRDLPWRNTKDPYLIWLSEVILQQTRVAQGMPYFLKFAQTYPRVQDLAKASEEDVLKLWQGLGYYSRARNMHHTAKYIAENLNGVFPNNYFGLIQLKGIGSYTAAAIASFAFKEAVAVLDGNVFRVLSRFYAQNEPINSSLGKKLFSNLAADFLNHKSPDIHNQALMELGSLVCTPSKPNCVDCPISASCLAFLISNPENFPSKIKKKAPTTRYFNYFLLKVNKQFAFVKRPSGDIWQNLYELPLYETENPLNLAKLPVSLLTEPWFRPKHKPKLMYNLKHILTHQRIEASFFEIDLNSKEMPLVEAQWFDKSSYKSLPISRLTEKFFDLLYSSEGDVPL